MEFNIASTKIKKTINKIRFKNCNEIITKHVHERGLYEEGCLVTAIRCKLVDQC